MMISLCSPKLAGLALINLLVFASCPAIAGDQWEAATNTGQETTNDPFLSRCKYQTVRGYMFSTTHRGLCPFSVEVEPESGRVRISQSGTSGMDERWEQASNIGREATGDVFISRCLYQTATGYRFSSDRRGLCPYMVEVNPETGRVKIQDQDYASPSRESGRWETATNTGEERTNDIYLTRCFYKTIGGYKFSTTSRGLCRFSVEINPETRQVR